MVRMAARGRDLNLADLTFSFKGSSPWSISVGLAIALWALRNINMPLLNLVVALIVVGVGLWLINRFIPMASSIKAILNVVVVVAVGVWVLQAAGLWNEVSNFRITR
jgi:hypothetical protein